MNCPCFRIITILFVLSAAVAAVAQEAPPSSSDAEDLVRFEKLRERVEEIFEEYRQVPGGGSPGTERLIVASRELAELGPEVVPFLENEAGLDDPWTFFLATYTLGRMPSEETDAILRRTIERMSRRKGSFGEKGKSWTCFCLAMQGRLDALDLANSEPFYIAPKELFESTPTLSVIAMALGPPARKRLLRLLDGLHADVPDRMEKQVYLLAALRQVPDDAMLSKVLPYLENENWPVRREAVGVLGELSGKEAVQAVLDRLRVEGEDARVRHAAGMAIEAQRPVDRGEAIAELLESETDTFVRGCLYRTLARIEGEAALDVLIAQWGRPDRLDRSHLVGAIGSIGNDRGLGVLRAALRDPDAGVAAHSARALASIGTPAARDTLLATVRAERWPVAQAAIDAALRLEEDRAASRVAAQLVHEDLSDDLDLTSARSRARSLTAAVVEFGFVECLDDLRANVSSQSDPEVRGFLRSAVGQLVLLERYGDDVDGWKTTLESPEHEVRHLAIRRLGEIGGTEAVDALLAHYESGPQEDRSDVLRWLAEAPTPRLRPLLETILTSPVYDDESRYVERDLAAWVAKEIGGDAMIEVLRRAVERREGQDARPLAYLASLLGKDAIPLLERLRPRRVMRPDWERGVEQQFLDRIARDLREGWPVEVGGIPLDGEHLH